jgi:excisionase family DNA binding protein
MNQPKRNLWDIKEAAAFLKMSPSWVYKRVSAGEIPHCKIGSAVRFMPEQMELYSDQRNSAGGSDNVIPIRKKRP